MRANGSIFYGIDRQERTAFHDISHQLGVAVCLRPIQVKAGSGEIDSSLGVNGGSHDPEQWAALDVLERKVDQMGLWIDGNCVGVWHVELAKRC